MPWKSVLHRPFRLLILSRLSRKNESSARETSKNDFQFYFLFVSTFQLDFCWGSKKFYGTFLDFQCRNFVWTPTEISKWSRRVRSSKLSWKLQFELIFTKRRKLPGKAFSRFETETVFNRVGWTVFGAVILVNPWENRVLKNHIKCQPRQS